MEIIQKVWPGDNPFTTDRHQILKAVKQELGRAGRDLNFNAYADNRSLFRYDMHTLPSEMSESIGTSTLFAAWNAAIYVAQIEDDRLGRRVGEQALSRRDPRGAAQARRAVVLRRVLRDLAAARLSPAVTAHAVTARAAPLVPPGRADRERRASPTFMRGASLRGDAAVGRRDRGVCSRRGAGDAGLCQRGAVAAAGGADRRPPGACTRAASSRCRTSRRATSQRRRARRLSSPAWPARRACAALLVIGGDRDDAGRRLPPRDRGDRERAACRAAASREIGIAGYPDGHPAHRGGRDSTALLAAKIEAAASDRPRACTSSPSSHSRPRRSSPGWRACASAASSSRSASASPARPRSRR